MHNESNCKIEFIIENLKSLEQSLNKINIPLTVISSNGFDEDPKKILDLVKERSITCIHWNNQFGIDEESRDKKAKELLETNNISCFSYDAQTLFPAGTFKTGEGKPYSVFTPFKKRWIENFDIDLLDIEYKYTSKAETIYLQILMILIFSLKKIMKLICLYGQLAKKRL